MKKNVTQLVHSNNSKEQLKKKNDLGKNSVKSTFCSSIILLATIAIIFASFYIFYGQSIEYDKEKKIFRNIPDEKSCKSKPSESQQDKLLLKKKRPKITNEYDMPLKKKLNRYDKLIKENPEKAIKKFDNLLMRYPDSPRASYGRAKALCALAEIKQSNTFLDQALVAYEVASKKKNILKKLRKMIHIEWSEKADFRGNNKLSSHALNKLLPYYPDDVEVLNRLGIQGLMRGQNKRAKKYFQRSLNIDPENGTANVHMAYIISNVERNPAESIPYFQRGLSTGEPATKHPRFYQGLGEAYLRTGQPALSKITFEKAAVLGFFPSSVQRSTYNAKTPLKAQPWWTAGETPYKKDIHRIEKIWKHIRKEGLAALGIDGLFESENEGLQDTGDWKQFVLFQKGKKNTKNCAKAPKTCALMETIKSASSCKRGQIKFSVMFPGTHVWPHTGPTNCRLRAHLGLKVSDNVHIRVANKTKTWNDGKIILFDDSFEHEIWHNGSELRIILIIDFWHPDLTDGQKRALSPI